MTPRFAFSCLTSALGSLGPSLRPSLISITPCLPLGCMRQKSFLMEVNERVLRCVKLYRITYGVVRSILSHTKVNLVTARQQYSQYFKSHSSCSKVVPLNFPWKIPALVTGFIFRRSSRSLLVSFECLAAFSVTPAVTNCCKGFHSHPLGKK